MCIATIPVARSHGSEQISFDTCPWTSSSEIVGPIEKGYRMALPDGLPDRKALHVFKAIYLLKDEIFV